MFAPATVAINKDNRLTSDQPKTSILRPPSVSPNLRHLVLPPTPRDGTGHAAIEEEEEDSEGEEETSSSTAASQLKLDPHDEELALTVDQAARVRWATSNVNLTNWDWQQDAADAPPPVDLDHHHHHHHRTDLPDDIVLRLRQATAKIDDLTLTLF